MKKTKSIVAALVMSTVLGTAALLAGCKSNNAESHSGHEHHYTCSMHPEVVQGGAGMCPKCGMKLDQKH